MIFTLQDGRQLDLHNIVRISKIRDQGEDASSIEYSTLSFTIYMSQRSAMEIQEQYHYADWSEKKLKLANLRNEILKLALQENPLIDTD